jgi:hypothetical protein
MNARRTRPGQVTARVEYDEVEMLVTGDPGRLPYFASVKRPMGIATAATVKMYLNCSGLYVKTGGCSSGGCVVKILFVLPLPAVTHPTVAAMSAISAINTARPISPGLTASRPGMPDRNVLAPPFTACALKLITRA